MADPRPKKAKICLCVFLCLLAAGVIAVVVGIRMRRRSSEHMKWNGTGSTAHFQEIVLERCYNYTQLVQPALRWVGVFGAWRGTARGGGRAQPRTAAQGAPSSRLDCLKQSIECCEAAESPRGSAE